MKINMVIEKAEIGSYKSMLESFGIESVSESFDSSLEEIKSASAHGPMMDCEYSFDGESMIIDITMKEKLITKLFNIYSRYISQAAAFIKSGYVLFKSLFGNLEREITEFADELGDSTEVKINNAPIEEYWDVKLKKELHMEDEDEYNEVTEEGEEVAKE